jgi:hypothetical protein
VTRRIATAPEIDPIPKHPMSRAAPDRANPNRIVRDDCYKKTPTAKRDRHPKQRIRPHAEDHAAQVAQNRPTHPKIGN